MKATSTYRLTPFRIERASALSLTVLLSLVLTFLAFLPFTERPEFANRNALALNRIIEISLLLISASLLSAVAAAFRVKIRFERKPLYLVAAFSFWALLTTIWSEAPLYTFGKSMELIVLVYITGLMSSLAVECERLGIDTVGSTLPTALLTAGAITVILTYFTHSSLFLYSEGYMRAGRLSIGTTHPLESADFISVTILAVLGSSFSWFRKAALMVLLIVGLVMTGSRAPMGLFVVATLVFMYVQVRSTNWRHIFNIWLGLMFILAVLFLLLFYQDIAALLPSDLATLNSRIPNWLFALSIAYDNALFGVGYFASREYLINFYTLNHAWGGLAHNTYIEIFLTTGVLGLLLLISFVIYGAVSAFETRSALLSGILVYLISRTILDAIFFSPELGMFVVMFLLAARPLLGPGRLSGSGGDKFRA